MADGIRNRPRPQLNRTRDTDASARTDEAREVREVNGAAGVDPAASFEGGGNAAITTANAAVTNVGSTLTDAQRRRLDGQLGALNPSDPDAAAIVDDARGALGDAAALPSHLQVLTGHGPNAVDGTLLQERRDDGSPRFVLRPRDPGLAPFEVPAQAAESLGAGRVQAQVVNGELKLKSLEPQIPDRFIAKSVEHEGVRGVTVGDKFVPFDQADRNPAVGTVVQVDLVPGDAGDRVKLVERLANAGSPEAELYDVVLARGLDPSFSKEVRAEVAALVDNPGIGDPKLVDLTDKAFVTIDNDSSMDLDQAMHIEKRPDGGFDLYYALADASYYVKPGTALFDEALERSTTVYLPGFCVPMLPRELSEDIVSLNPPKDDISARQKQALKSGDDVQSLLGQGFSERELCDMGIRRSLVFKISVDKDGLNPKTEAFQGTIRSRAKLSYNGVQASHDGRVYEGSGQPEAGAEYTPTLQHLEELGKLRITAAEKRGVVHFNRTNVKVKVGGGDQHGFTMLEESRNEVEKWNEQISLLCNMEGAKMLKEAGQGMSNLQPIFRVHDAPPVGRIKGMQRVIDALVDSKGLPDSYRWDDAKEPLADYLRRLPQGTDEEQRLFAGIQRQAIMTNVASEFQEEAKGHHGVGAEAYARFSSPMREMVGIFTHKELIEVLDGHGDKPANPQDKQLQDEVIDAAMSAKRLQKKVNKEANRMAIDDLFERDLKLPDDERPVRKGTVMGFDRGKIHVQLDDPPIEVKVYLAELRNATGERQKVDKSSAFVENEKTGEKLHLGDAIDIACVGYDEERDRFILRPIV